MGFINVQRHPSGFSLVELLTVVVIILLGFALVTPAFQSVARSSNLSTAAALVADELALARGLAIAHARSTEVRFYEKDGSPKYDSLRVLREDADGNFVDARRRIRLPDGVIIDASTTLSPMFDDASISTGSEPIALSDAPVSYRAIRFGASGRAELSEPTPDCVLTLRAETDPASVPSNYVAIQITPETGRVRTYRP